jgi:hypothetical protein
MNRAQFGPQMDLAGRCWADRENLESRFKLVPDAFSMALRCIVFGFAACMATLLPAREWADNTGRKLEGEMLGVERACAVVLLPDKHRASLPLDKLSTGDQAWVKLWAEGKSAEQQLPAPIWPQAVQQPEIKLTGGANSKGGFEFHSPHYEFDCDAEVSTSVMTDFATVAEGTVRLLYSLPIQLAPLEHKTFTARICASRASYERGGGVPGSAGVFITANLRGEGVLLVPFESLGIEKFNGHNTKSYSYRPNVLAHEMTHQITAELLQLMPKWVAEGLADYVGHMIYRNGVYYLSERDRVQALHMRLDMYDNLTREQEQRVVAAPSRFPEGRGQPATLPESWLLKPSELVSMSEDYWDTSLGGRNAQIRIHRMYLSSMFLMHYFLHLADHGEARRIRTYFEELNRDAVWFKNMGKDGTPPPAYLTHRMTLDEVRAHYLGILFSKDDLKALDTDFHDQYVALGFRLPAWK